MQAAQSFETPVFIKEDETFWQWHLKAYHKSGLNGAAYCRSNKLNYPRFLYWSTKLKKAAVPFIPVQLNNEGPVARGTEPTPLCTLTLKSGADLRIHHREALIVILEKWG
jgi:hypothetical protein